MKKSLVIFCAFAAAFGAVVVGLNMGGISGAINIIEHEFILTSLAKGFVTGSLLIGCLIGALIGGGLSDRYGRKPLLYVSAFFSVYLLSDAGVLLLRGFILLSIALLAALEPAFYPL